MKVKIYVNCQITGWRNDEQHTPAYDKVSILTVVSLPFLPRIGDEMRFCEFNNAVGFIHSATVAEIRWCPPKGKKGIMEPIIILQDLENNETDGKAGLPMTIQERRERLLQDLREESNTSSDVVWQEAK